MLPYLALCIIVLLVVGLDRARLATRARVIVSFAILGLAFFLSWAQAPQFVRRVAVVTLLAATATAALITIWRRVRDPRRAAVAATSVFALAGLLSFGVQQAVYPRSVWADQKVPTAIAALQGQAAEAVGDTIVVGNPLAWDPSAQLWEETLFANSWYVNPHSVINRYQLLGFRGFNEALCLGYLGETCPQLAENLFEIRPATGLTLADQLSISSVQIVKTEETETYLDDPPDGWRVVADEQFTQMWVREEPLAGAGGIVAASEGLQVADVESTPEGVTATIVSVPQGGGTLTFSRLAWPGYAVSGGVLGEPADGFLLTVDVPEGQTGELVVAFKPAGFTLALAFLGIAISGAVGWSIVARARTRRTLRRVGASGG